MSSKAPDGSAVSETDEGTIPLHKKRARRVSFAAEITSVHVFDRDDDTPPDPKPSSDDRDSNPSFSFFHEISTEDSKESSQNGEEGEDDDEELDARMSFLRPMESPSPGSTFGSATSNDEDNFFGPVSASFIRPGRLSDSAVSDDNHDITMDSTAFSMHFRSLARSDSGVDLKTPTGIHLSFEEKTPTQNTIPTYQGSSMVLAVANKPITESSTPFGKSSRSTDSNDMSLVGEVPVKYDYARLSPELNALLAEGSKNLHAAPLSFESTISASPLNMNSRFSPKKQVGMMEPSDNRDREMGIITTKDVVEGKLPFADKSLDDANGGNNSSPVRHMTCLVMSDMQNAPAFDVLMEKSHCSLNQPSEGLLSIKNTVSNDSEMKSSSNCMAVASPRLDLTSRVECETPLAGSFSLLSGEQRRKILDRPTSLQNLQTATPSQGQLDFRRDEIKSCAESVSSIKKSISRLRMLRASPLSSSFKLTYNSPLISSANLFSTPQGNKVQDIKGEDASTKQLSPLVPGDEFVSSFQGNGERKHGMNVDSNDTEMPDDSANGRITSVGHETDLRDDGRIKSRLATVTNRLDSLFMENRQSISPIIKTNNSKEFSILQTTDNGATNPCSPEFGVSGPPSTHVLCQTTNNSAVLERNVQIDQEPMKFQQNLDEGPFRQASLGSTSGFIPNGDNEPPSQKKLVEQSNRSPSRNVPNGAMNSVRLPSVDLENAVSPKCSQLRDGLKISAQKRKRNNVIPQSNGRLDEIARTKASPKLPRIEGGNTEMLPEEHNESNGEASTLAHGTILLRPTDALSKISEDLKELISLSTDKLTLEEVDVFEDVLNTQRRLHAYEILFEIQSQKSLDHQSNLQQKRAAEMKLLLQKYIHEQAKMQLMSLKRDRLLKKAETLKSGIQESEVLKMNTLPGLSEPRAEKSLQLIDLGTIPGEQVTGDNVTALREELKVYRSKIANLTKSFQTSCKMIGESSGGDMILRFRDHLTKKASCRSIRLDSQLWEVDKVESTEGSHIITLNYLGFVTQRFKIKSGPVSSITSSMELNKLNISKVFPSIDACTAFAFALNASTAEKIVGSRNFAQETQMTSSVLSNLLDVTEELQVACLELQNLTQMRFCSPSVVPITVTRPMKTTVASLLQSVTSETTLYMVEPVTPPVYQLTGELELLLTFISFKCGKVTLTFNISCLKCAVYPSEIGPSRIAGGSAGSLPEPLVAQVRCAVRSLGAGYMRIIRLCRSISQVVQAWSR